MHIECSDLFISKPHCVVAVFGSAGRLFVDEKLCFANHGNRQVFDLDNFVFLPSGFKFYAVNLRDNVDTARHESDLKNHSGRLQIVERQIEKRCAESLQGIPNFLCVFFRTTNPKVNIARGANESVKRHHIIADYEKFNFFFAKRG